MLNLDEAHVIIAQHTYALEPVRVPLAEAHGCVLRESVVAPEDVPAFDRSAFDGFAFRAADAPGKLRVCFEVAAGVPSSGRIAEGECARIFTGGQIPEGADSVAMQEDVKLAGVVAEIPATSRGHGVRLRGEDARAGDLLLARGLRLGAVELAMLAQIGHVRPLVAPRIRVFHVATGSELVAPDSQPEPGRIRDSNSTLIAALAREAGCDIIAQRRAGDQLPGLIDVLRRVPDTGWELLLISGGASVGDYDFGRRALDELGFGVHFTQVNLRPGKPLIFGTRGRQCAFVIPGNPLSHLVCWHVAIRVAIAVLSSGDPMWMLESTRLSGGALRGNPRETWWPARVRGGVAEPLKWKSSGDLTGLAGVNALLRIPADSAGIGEGSLLQALRL